MDTLSHALWGRGVFGYKGFPKTALLFGCFPDLISFGLLIFINIISGQDFKSGPPDISILPNWLFISYNFGHSLVISSLSCYLMSFYNKKVAYAMLAWPLHVILDFPFHSIEYFPTPILYPLHDYKFDGIPWSNPYIWFSNIAGIILLYVWRYKNK